MSAYKVILKTTSLLASLRIVTIMLTVGTSKLIAFLLGASGIGFYGVLNSTLSLVTSIADLGISKSSIRNISEAKGEGNHDKVEHTISIVSKLIFVTGALGAFLTMLFSYYISIWSFGNSTYWFSFVLLGLAVFFTLIKNGQGAIFQGLREYKIITKNTIISAVGGFIFSMPLIYFFKNDGILYAIIATAFIAFLSSKYFINNLSYKIDAKKVKLTRSNSQEIIKLGLAMMWVSFLVAFSGYIIRSYISVNSNLVEVGYFQAGFQIISGYFGIIFTSMAADYFPRISAINKDNDKLSNEVNQQAIITLLLICPLVVILPYIMPLVISILYTSEFTSTVDYVNFALFGIILQAGSQTMDMVLLAKNNAKIFTISIFLFRVIFLALNILGYEYYGILGLGITFSANMLIHLIGMQLINYKMYKISFDRHFVLTLLAVLGFCSLAFFTRNLNDWTKYLAASILIGSSLLFTYWRFKKLLKISSPFDYIKNKIGRKK